MTNIIGNYDGNWSQWLGMRPLAKGKKSKPAIATEPTKPFKCDIFSLPLPLLFPALQSVSVSVPKSEDSDVFVPNSHLSTLRKATCLTCRITFDHREEQMSHFKSDLHRHNLTRKANGECPVDSEQFREHHTQVIDSDDDLFPSSGEDEQSDKEAGDDFLEGDSPVDTLQQIYSDSLGEVTKSFHPKTGPLFHFAPVHLNGWRLSFSSALFPTDSPFADSRRWFEPDGQLWTCCYQQLVNLHKRPLIAVLILRSGRFAGAVFDNSSGTSKVVVHKAIRRYTVRAKAGGGQSSHDNKGGKARSMGAQLRRYGEQALEEDVQRLVTMWQDYLDNCGVILIATTKTMRPLLFEKAEGGNNHVVMLKKNDQRVVSVPFAVDKPTLEAAEYIHSRVITAVIHPPSISSADSLCTLLEEESLPVEQAGGVDSDGAVEDNAVVGVEEVPEMPLCLPSVALIEACSSQSDESASKIVLEMASLYGAQHGELDGEWTWPTIVNYPSSLQELTTALHVASRRGLVDTIEALLEQGANPEREDVRGRTPFLLCSTKEARNAFRKARAQLGEQSWNWAAAGVPEALTDEKLKAQKEKEKEKRKKAQQRKKEQKVLDDRAIQEALHLKQAEEVAKQIEQEEEEARLRDLAGCCAVCAKSLYKEDFFEVLSHRCCSTDCAAKVRRQLAAEAAIKRFAK